MWLVVSLIVLNKNISVKKLFFFSFWMLGILPDQPFLLLLVPLTIWPSTLASPKNKVQGLFWTPLGKCSWETQSAGPQFKDFFFHHFLLLNFFETIHLFIHSQSIY